jgi:hypothetical protein
LEGGGVNCPKCDADISDTFERDDPSCGIVAGWYCDACDIGVAQWEAGYEPRDDDVPIATAREMLGDRPLGTPISALSGQPGDPNNLSDPRHAGYAEFLRIAKSWGYD